MDRFVSTFIYLLVPIFSMARAARETCFNYGTFYSYCVPGYHCCHFNTKCCLNEDPNNTFTAHAGLSNIQVIVVIATLLILVTVICKITKFNTKYSTTLIEIKPDIQSQAEMGTR